MTRPERIESAISKLWTFADKNPLALIAIAELQDMRERNQGWLHEDELPEGYDYDANFERSEVRDGVRMFPSS